MSLVPFWLVEELALEHRIFVSVSAISSDLAVPRDKPANVRKLKAWHFGHESGYILKSQDLPMDKQQEKRSE